VTRPYRVAPDYLRTGQVAELLQVSPKTITRWAKEGRLPFLKTLGNHRRYPADKIRDLIEELTHQPTDRPSFAQIRRQP
jgi:excisionase family DNA binding protein